jgi:hypothetical protein
MAFRRKMPPTASGNGKGTAYRICHFCGKSRTEVVMVQGKGGHWYCNERERARGDRARGG